MENDKALSAVVRSFDLQKNVDDETEDAQFSAVVSFIDDLIRNDFNRLLSILYRVDISELKLKKKLAENKEKDIPSAEVIAQLLIEREQEKIISRAKYRPQ